MKCKYCEGTGKIKMPTFDDEMPILEEDCGKCHGTGEIEVTNEEWFCSLSTEEKAKFLKNFNPCDKCPARKICDTVRNCENSFLKWLKEKHEE